MKRVTPWSLVFLVSAACAGTETGNPPAEPIVEPFEGGEPDLEHTRYKLDASSVDRGHAFGVEFSRAALPEDTLFVTATVLHADGWPEDFTFDGEELIVGFNRSPPVVLRIQPVAADGAYASSDLFVAEDGSISVHRQLPPCLKLLRNDLLVVPANVVEAVGAVVRNDCESEQTIEWSVLGDDSLIDVLSPKPLRIGPGDGGSISLLPTKNEAGAVSILVDPGGGLEQLRALSVRLLSP